MGIFSAVFRALLHIPARHQVGPDSFSLKAQRLINLVSLFLALTLLIQSIGAWRWSGEPRLYLSLLGLMGLMIAIWWQNRQGHFYLARVALLLLMEGTVVTMAWLLGPRADMYVGSILTLSLPFLFFPPQDKKWIACFTGLFLLTGILLLLDPRPEGASALFSSPAVARFRLIKGINVSILIAIVFYHLYRENARQVRSVEAALAQAQAATQARSDFLSTMSHEIRTPLNAIIGMTDLLQASSLDDNQTDYVRTINLSGDSLLHIINDILDFSKIEAGLLELEDAPFDLVEPLEDTLELVAARAYAKGLHLALAIGPDLPAQVRGDITRLRQVLLNLASNAVKFTAEGEIVLTAETLPGPAGRILFSVRDTGIGIPADRQRQIFEAFTQVDASTTRRFGGSGLGLAISQRLVRLMGGELSVMSKPGQGSVFEFSLPLTAQPAPEGWPVHVLSGKPLLIVEPHPISRRTLTQWARQWGMEVQAVSHVSQETAPFSSHPPAVALVDIAHAGPNRLASLRELARQPLALILMSPDPQAIPPALRGLATAVLRKPLRHQILRDALRAALSPEELPSPSLLASTAPVSRPPLRILLAEDNPVNQKVASRMLATLNQSCQIAPDGAAALAAVKTADFDLILMDMFMPQLDGPDATRHIRQHLTQNQRPQPYIIAMTANALSEARDICAAAGMDDFLAKPVKLDHLGAMLEKWFPTRVTPS